MIHLHWATRVGGSAEAIGENKKRTIDEGMAMTIKKFSAGIFVMMMLSVLSLSNIGYSGDLDDGISEYKDESIRGDDAALKTDKNINFIVLEAISNSQKKNKSATSNFNDGSGDNNENSVVVGPGTQVGDVTNVIIQK